MADSTMSKVFSLFSLRRARRGHTSDPQNLSVGRPQDQLITQAVRSRPEYATREDFSELFRKETNALYQLAFLLTADHEKAEQLLITGLEQCIKGNPVFKEWAHTWARRVVIKSAIQMVAPTPGQISELTDDTSKRQRQSNALSATITAMPPFNRFVFVMSVLERFSDTECAAFLACTRSEVVEARTQALRKIGLNHNVTSERRSRMTNPCSRLIGSHPLFPTKVSLVT